MKVPAIIKKIYRGLIWQLPAADKTIYLTFDDGPTPGVTDNLLDLLKSYNVKATFFCIGRNIERHPEIVQRILNEGHVVGNHTYSHLKGWKTDNAIYFNDIELAQNHYRARLFRPPYGKIRKQQARELIKHYKIIMWDIMSYDFHPKRSKEKCYSLVDKNIQPGSIVVFHDSIKAKEKMLFIVPRIIEKFTSLGYSFGTIN